jgi:pre-mRNA-splicing factor SPF27
MALVLQNGRDAPTASSSTAKGKRPLYTSSLLPFTDALPYYDRDIDTDAQLRAKVEREVERETEKMRKEKGKGKEREREMDERIGKAFEFTKVSTSMAPLDAALLESITTSCGKLEHPAMSTRSVEGPGLTSSLCLCQLSPLVTQEIERVGRREAPASALDTSRYQLPTPAAGDEATEADWDAALRNSSIQLAQQDLRMSNVELLKQYGSNAWRLHNFQQEAFLKEFTTDEQARREETTAINRKRKEAQVKVGNDGKLGTLERRWAELISNNLQVEVANIAATHEIEELRIKRRKLQAELDKMDEEEQAMAED